MALRTWTSMNALRTFCALILLSLGLAHEPVKSEILVEAYSEAYRLPDGSFADICAAAHERSGDMDRVVCEVCLLASSIVLPPPTGDAWLSLADVALANPLRMESEQLGPTAVARLSARGPPLQI